MLFGELHDNPIVHWLQYQTTSDLFRVTPFMVLGAEMFETDQQAALNEYLNPTDTSAKTSTVVTPMGDVMGGDPAYDKFKKSTKLWPNFYTDYKPLVDFAKEHQMPFIATNIPANMPAWYTAAASPPWIPCPQRKSAVPNHARSV